MWLVWLWRMRRPLWRGVKIGAIGVLLLFAIGLITREAGRGWLVDKLHAVFAPVYRTQPSPVVIVERLRAMQRLETARQTTIHDVAVESSNGLPVWLAGERLRMRAVAEASAGIDLAKLRPEHIQISGRRVWIALPEPQLFEVVIREAGTEVYHRERGWLTFRPDQTIEQRARRQAWLEARHAALQGELLPQARQNAAEELKRLLTMLGFEQATVGWNTAQASSTNPTTPTP
ncbi:MAG: hypothetical protein KatS3mg020_0303 [Fimbriimonadales bacterium]|nr:MAG: hypothetical protein KatS3mg020_0303 [Fimbriimonadales bacterium]